MVAAVCTTLVLIGGLGLVTSVAFGGHTGHRSGHAHGHRTAGANRQGAGSKLAFLLGLASPIVIFSVCIGAGAAGLVALHFRLPLALIVVTAAVGGLILYAGCVRPLTGLLLNFASAPSKALDGALAGSAEVISRFDSSGKGLVLLTVDGQFIRVLAKLDEADVALSSQISPGDKVIVTKVDPHTNTCTVARF